jgi:uncharacterized membrane protein HdeD (DUF308 family)
MPKVTIRFWWVFLVSGFALLCAGSLVLVYSAGTSVSLASALGWVVVLVGVSHIIFAAGNNKILPRWTWYLAAGILDVIMGMLLLIYPDIIEVVLPFLPAIWFLARGISMIIYTFTLRHLTVKGWIWFLAGGLLITAFTVFISHYESFDFFTIALWTALGLMITGIVDIFLAFRLRIKREDNEAVII